MPYLSNRYPHHEVPETTRGAFYVPEHVHEQWQQYLESASVNGHDRPRNWRGHSVRPYPAMDVPVHPPYAPAGIYTDHRDPTVEQYAYEQRDRLNGSQDTLQQLAVEFGLRHWRDGYNTVRNVGRRRTGENGRDDNGDLRWRRWNTTWATHTDASGHVQAASEFRQFGIELEYGHPVRNTSYEARAAIVDSARAAGMLVHECWDSWSLDPRYPRHWQCCHDGTVSGSEIVSPIMDGDDASHNVVRTMINIIRDNGGHAESSQGLHVHHNASDFDQADRSRLIRNLRAVERAMGAYVYQPRTTRNFSCGATYTEDHEWDEFIRAVDAGRIPHSHAYRYRFFNLEHFAAGSTGSRIEFRGMGNSMNPGKIRTWIRMGQAVMAATKAGHEFPANCTTEQLIDGARQHGNLSEWAANKWLNRVNNTRPALV